MWASSVICYVVFEELSDQISSMPFNYLTFEFRIMAVYLKRNSPVAKVFVAELEELLPPPQRDDVDTCRYSDATHTL